MHRLICQTIVCRNWHQVEAVPPSCRGFVGPIPPPLWMRLYLIRAQYNKPEGARQLVAGADGFRRGIRMVLCVLAGVVEWQTRGS